MHIKCNVTVCLSILLVLADASCLHHIAVLTTTNGVALLSITYHRLTASYNVEC